MFFLEKADMYKTALLPDPAVVKDFWQDFKAQPHNAGHTVHSIPESDLCDIQPLVIHIDGVRIFKSSGHNVENLVYSVSSPLVRGSAFNTKFMITQMPLWQMAAETNDNIVGFILWMLEQLRRGEEPRIGFHGESLVPPGKQQRRFRRTLFVGTKHDDKEKVHQHRCS